MGRKIHVLGHFFTQIHPKRGRNLPFLASKTHRPFPGYRKILPGYRKNLLVYRKIFLVYRNLYIDIRISISKNQKNQKNQNFVNEKKFRLQIRLGDFYEKQRSQKESRKKC